MVVTCCRCDGIFAVAVVFFAAVVWLVQSLVEVTVQLLVLVLVLVAMMIVIATVR